MVEMNNKVRACKDDDLFCFTLEQVVAARNYSQDTGAGQVKICELFSITAA